MMKRNPRASRLLTPGLAEISCLEKIKEKRRRNEENKDLIKEFILCLSVTSQE